MSIEIHRIIKSNELGAVYRQRYSVYVKELHYSQRYVNHAERKVIEPLDDNGHILGAFDGDMLVASVRINYGSEAALGDYVDLYDMPRFALYFPERLSICTKFIVSRSYRSGTLMTQLSKACYEYRPVHEMGNVFNLIDSKPPLDGYFRRLGYRQIRPNISHPDAGEVVPLVLPIFDRTYLAAIGSPFANLLPGMRDDESVRWFYETFADQLACYNARQPFGNRTISVFQQWEKNGATRLARRCSSF
jgi:hypothetical protein